MKFQDSSFNGLKVTVGTKSVTHAPTHPRTNGRSKSNMPHQLFQSWGHNNVNTHKLKRHRNSDTRTGKRAPQQNYRIGTVSNELLVGNLC